MAGARKVIAGLLLRIVISMILTDVRDEVIEHGRISVYWPRDAMNTGNVMACDGGPARRLLYERGSVHLAMRNWREIGCGTEVIVCARETGRCLIAPVLDSGPWGTITGERKNAKKEGRWRKPRNSKEAFDWLARTPLGWRFSALVDLSYELWNRLGRPKPLSFVAVYWSRRRR